jgi:hypothetical protein
MATGETGRRRIFLYVVLRTSCHVWEYRDHFICIRTKTNLAVGEIYEAKEQRGGEVSFQPPNTQVQETRSKLYR